MALKFTFEQTQRADYIKKADITSFKNGDISVFPHSIRKNVKLKNDKIIENLPHIVINSYAQNTVLNELINLIGEAFKALKKKLGKEQGISDGTEKHFEVEDLKLFAKAIQDICAGLTTQHGVLDFAKTVSDNMNPTNISGKGGDIALGEFPAQLYYALLGSTKLGSFILPFINIEGYMQTNGTYGYSKSSNVLEGILPNNALLNMALGNIGINIMPIFKPGSGADDATISFTVNLINDELVYAEKNIEFLCSLFGGNKWIQYGFVQFPGALYDIVIPGAMRYMLCTGTFSVEPIGSIRKLKNEITIGPSGFKFPYIPDAYSLKLQFNTLLPNNFNTFLYSMWLDNETDIIYDKGESNIPGFIEGISEALMNISFGEETRRELDKRVSEAHEELNELQAQETELTETIKNRFSNESNSAYKYDTENGILVYTGNSDAESTEFYNALEEFNALTANLNEVKEKCAVAEKELQARKNARWTAAYARDRDCIESQAFLQKTFPNTEDINSLTIPQIKETYNSLSADKKAEFDERFGGPKISNVPDDMSLVQFVSDNADTTRNIREETLRNNSTAAPNNNNTTDTTNN